MVDKKKNLFPTSNVGLFFQNILSFEIRQNSVSFSDLKLILFDSAHPLYWNFLGNLTTVLISITLYFGVSYNQINNISIFGSILSKFQKHEVNNSENDSNNESYILDPVKNPILAVKNLTKSYGKHKVLSDLNVSFEKDAISILLGNNGCGKSTLMYFFNS